VREEADARDRVAAEQEVAPIGKVKLYRPSVTWLEAEHVHFPPLSQDTATAEIILAVTIMMILPYFSLN
jgi:hypothetical protein